MPHLNQLGADPLPHDTYDPSAWPTFALAGEAKWFAIQYRARSNVMHMSSVADWARSDVAGHDSYWHLRPRHVAKAMAMVMDAQLRQPVTTSFTLIMPWVNDRTWRKYLKHFRRQRRIVMQVEGLGPVVHLMVRYEAGDGMLGKVPRVQKREWEMELGWCDGVLEDEPLHQHQHASSTE